MIAPVLRVLALALFFGGLAATAFVWGWKGLLAGLAVVIIWTAAGFVALAARAIEESDGD